MIATMQSRDPVARPGRATRQLTPSTSATIADPVKLGVTGYGTWALRHEHGRLSPVLKQPEDVAVGVGDRGNQAAVADVTRGLVHSSTRSGQSGQLRLDIRHVPVGNR